MVVKTVSLFDNQQVYFKLKKYRVISLSCQRNLTKNETPLSLTISKKPKKQQQITKHSMMITAFNTAHTLYTETSAAAILIYHLCKHLTSPLNFI